MKKSVKGQGCVELAMLMCLVVVIAICVVLIIVNIQPTL
jgi:hypothetical protein